MFLWETILTLENLKSYVSKGEEGFVNQKANQYPCNINKKGID